MNISKTQENILTRLHPLQRMIVSVLMSFITFFIIKNDDLSILLIIMILWNVFALSFAALSWFVILNRKIDQIKQAAVKDDGSIVFVFVMILVSCFASLFTVLLLMISDNDEHAILSIILSVTGMTISWIMIHTLFTLHYAHMFYNENKKASKGLNFPEDDKPDYIDFAYFSFVIGCTFQVSDVEITSKHIRRVVLLHGLLSFAINTFVVALTINLIAGARK